MLKNEPMADQTHYRIIILGSGAAGLTAALYTARANLEPLVVEGSQPGGQLTITTDVENYPGFPDGIMGPDMMDQFRKQAERFGTKIVYGDVTAVELGTRPIVTTSGQGPLHVRRPDHRHRRHGQAAGARGRKQADGTRGLRLRHL